MSAHPTRKEIAELLEMTMRVKKRGASGLLPDLGRSVQRPGRVREHAGALEREHPPGPRAAAGGGHVTTFKKWLRSQRHRQDAVGDFARDWCADPDAPPVRLHRQIERYLNERGVEEKVQEAARRAWVEWMRS